ncbi:MAG: hypothetical protein R2830_25115 [Saprospiraceae bacterium]
MKNFIDIESYLWGNMTAEEKAAFEQKMAADPDLALEVEVQRLELKAIGQAEEAHWLAQMKAWRNAADSLGQDSGGSGRSNAGSGATAPQEATVRKLAGRRLLLWAVAVAACIAIFFFARPFFQPDAARIVSQEKELPAQLSSGLKSTEPGIPPTDSLSILFLQGYAALDAGKFGEAQTAFKSVSESGQAEEWLKQAAEFQLALALVGLEEYAAARERLQAIEGKPGHRYRGRAEQLLGRLEKME